MKGLREKGVYRVQGLGVIIINRFWSLLCNVLRVSEACGG